MGVLVISIGACTSAAVDRSEHSRVQHRFRDNSVLYRSRARSAAGHRFADFSRNTPEDLAANSSQ
jgi:hypothetical protein